jgi:hypothetical protein
LLHELRELPLIRAELCQRADVKRVATFVGENGQQLYSTRDVCYKRVRCVRLSIASDVLTTVDEPKQALRDSDARFFYKLALSCFDRGFPLLYLATRELVLASGVEDADVPALNRDEYANSDELRHVSP